MKFTQLQAKELLQKWQPILRLSDWDIEVSTRPRKRMLHRADGTNSVYTGLKESEINIVESKPSSTDHETVVVHELMHCHTDPIATEENEKEVESLIEDVSKAFVRLDRRWSRKYEKLLGEFREYRSQYPRNHEKKEEGNENS